MCLRKDKRRYIGRRYYHLLFTNRYIFLGKKKYDRNLFIEVENNKGDISFEIVNKTTNEIIKLDNPNSDTYNFHLNKDNKYMIHINSNGACGHYKIYYYVIEE